MRNEVRREALKATSRVVFSITFLGGCSAASSASDRSGGSEADIASQSADGATPHDAGPDSTAGATKDCEQLLAAAFPIPSDYPGTKKSVSKEVQACCAVEAADAYRWDCCANFDADDPRKVGPACTPWGPPVPPPMTPRARRERPPLYERASVT